MSDLYKKALKNATKQKILAIFEDNLEEVLNMFMKEFFEELKFCLFDNFVNSLKYE